MKTKVLLLVITLTVGVLIIAAAQILPDYRNALVNSLPLLAIVFCLLLLILNPGKDTRITDGADGLERARRRRIKHITATVLGVILVGALAMILSLPRDLIAIPISLIAIVCVGSLGIAFWADRPGKFRS